MIRQAKKEDLLQICKVHARCFPDSYSTQMCRYANIIGGGNLLVPFYGEFMKDAPELFLVAANENEIVGFCMGYYMTKQGQIQRFISKNRMKFVWKNILLLMQLNHPAWRKVFNMFSKSSPDIIAPSLLKIPVEQRVDLLSICILPEHRGSGLAQQMIEEFLSRSKQQGMKSCHLSVEASNARAISYYERNGFLLYSHTPVKRVYIKIL